jgi:V/A-type H+-transporting ATPase subunit E
MTGLDKIIQEILDEANAAAQAQLDEAKKEAASILDEAKAQSEALSSDISNKAQTEQKNIEEKAKSSVDMQKRQAVLKAKQEVISEVIDLAYEKVLAQDDDAYFAMIKKMLETYAVDKDGEIYFSAKDLGRLPAGFESVINDAAAKHGGTLKLSREPKELDGGFILVYGGIEENCSIKAMFDAKRDVLADKVHGLLFSA